MTDTVLRRALELIVNLDPHQSDLLEAQNYARAALAESDKMRWLKRLYRWWWPDGFIGDWMEGK